MRRFFWFLIAVLLIVAGILLLDGEQASPQGRQFKVNTATFWVGEDPVDQAVREYEERIINEYLAAMAAEQETRRQADLEAAMAAPRPASPPTSVGVGGCENIPAWFPQTIAYRESHCSYDAYNPTGCGGQGCIGAFQFDARHFTGWANGTAACGDLDPWTVDGQNECAWRLSRNGTSFTPWGG